MGLSWQQGPLSLGANGRFLVPDPLPARLLFVEPLRRRLRVRFAGAWIADSEQVILLFEPGRYPVAYFPETDIASAVLERIDHSTRHQDLGPTSWFAVRSGDQLAQRAAWQHTGLPAHASELQSRVAFAWRAMDAFFEEDERILGHAADPYHRIDIRDTSRHLVVRHGEQIIADTTRPLVLYESGFAPRWYVPRADVDESALTLAKNQTFCPYKGICSYYGIGETRGERGDESGGETRVETRPAAWAYPDAYPEVGRIANCLSFEPDVVTVHLDGKPLRLEPGQSVIPHGPDRELTLREVLPVR